MTTITKEWLQQTIAEFENTRDDIPFGLSDDDAKILIVLKRALVSLDAEPVLYAAEETLAYAKMGELHLTCLSEPMGDAVIPLYTAPPVPVVPEKMSKHALFEVAIARFSKMNEGFPIKRFKADWVISWMLENFPPVAQKQGDN
ncbi:hypothetical protein AH853_22265 [Salmonella enterica subsp. enterica serovar Newport]|nr:hypothetical protein [Salmonella enterica subsp. enterica serovar Bareilly]EDE1959600.1 hypothetical protein [Salmonella enterica subsp. enterica serovar Newport]